MRHQKASFWLAYLVLVGLILIRILPFINPTGRFWGFEHLVYLPDFVTLIFFIVTGVALILPFLRKADKWGDALSEFFSRKFLSGPHSLAYRLAFSLAMMIVFIAFVAPTHFLGDCYILIKNLAPATGMFFKWDQVGIFKWSEIGIAKFMIMVKSLAGGTDEAGALLAFRVVSIASGVVTIWLFFLIARVATDNKVRQLIIFASSFLSGTLLQFFGYAEYYHILWAFQAALLYFCMKFMKQGKGILPAWILIVIGIVFHMQLAIFLPAILFATLSAGKGLAIYGRHRIIVWALVSISVLGVIAGLFYKYTTDLYIEDMFLPLIHGKPVDPSYAAFSPTHLADIVNEFILIAPFFFVALILGVRNISTLLKRKKLIFLALASIGCLLFLFFVDPKLGMPRDWDLFSITPYAITLLFILLIDESTIQSIRKLIPAIIIILAVYSVPYLLTNLNRGASSEYVERLIKLDSNKTIAGLIILYDYYKEIGDNDKARELGYMYHTVYTREIKCSQAMDAMDEGNIRLARTILDSIEPNRFDASYQRALARLYSMQGDYDRALKHIDWTIELRRYFSQVYRERAMVYLNLNDHDEVYRDLRKAHQLDDSNIVILEGLAYVNSYYKQYDSSIFYARRMLQVDSSSPIAYYWMANGFLSKDNIDSASFYADECAIRLGQDTILAVGLDNLIKQVEKIKYVDSGR